MFDPAPAFEGAKDKDCGRVIITSAIVVIPRAVNSSALMVVTGKAASVSRRLIKEPVTSTLLKLLLSCACTLVIMTNDANAMALSKKFEWAFLFMKMVSKRFGWLVGCTEFESVLSSASFHDV